MCSSCSFNWGESIITQLIAMLTNGNFPFFTRDVYNQILSILTYSHMTKIFERRKNFDLRRLLSGSERLFYNLLANDSSSAKGKDI